MEIVISYIATAVIGFIVSKIGNKAKYLRLGGEAVAMVNEIVKASADHKITEDEVKRIAASYEKVKEVYKELKS